MGLSLSLICRLRVIPRTVVPRKDCTFLLQISCSDFGPDVSFDKSASAECLFSLAHASLAGVSKICFSSGCSEGDYTSSCPPNDLKDLVKTFCITLDLHPRFPDHAFTMDRLPGDAIGVYSKFLHFSGIRIPFSTFLLSMLKYFKNTEDICMDDGPSSLKNWKNKFFLIDRRAIPDHLTWRHSCSCVSDDLPADGYDTNDVERLRVHLIRLREMKEEVLIHSGLSYVWFNKECDPMSIYNFMTLPSLGDVKIIEEPYHLSTLFLERVPPHTTAPAAEDALILLPTLDKVAAAQPNPRLARKSKGPSQVRVRSALTTAPKPSPPSKKRRLKKGASEAGCNAPELGQAEGLNEADITNFCAKLEDSLKRDEGTFIRAASVPTPRLGKRLGPPPSMVVTSVSVPSHVGTLAQASTSGRSLALGGSAIDSFARKSRAKAMRCQMDLLDALARNALSRDAEYDEIPKDDFGTATRSEEIELTLFPLAPGPYQMPYLYDDMSYPLYTKEEWDESHALESNILCRDIFKDPNVCRKALDLTITPAELKKTESLLRLELSNRVNVLSALLVSHGMELNSHYTGLVASRVCLQEKLDCKTRYVKVLRSEVTYLDDKLEKVQRDCDVLGQENKELRSQRDVASKEVKKFVDPTSIDRIP
ncbi:hypothetical protein Tco_1406134 [Tanacetum coccineum]